MVGKLTVVVALLAWTLPARASDQLCEGEYADDLMFLAPRARTFDRQPEAAFSYCVRNTARYECLSYDVEGNIKKRRSEVVAHGTAFGYRREGADTLLLTNDHVAVWPAVTDADHPVEGIPRGCKKVSETLAIVDNENDGFAPDDISLNRLVTDPVLDAAVLRAHAPLSIMPWKVGHSAALRERNIVEVHGFPLGAFRATNVGKVVSAYDHDEYGGWDHEDFIVDALLSSGNSGSPVLAVSCRTGELELVGLYHAGYSRGSALNAVIGVDQVRTMMATLKRDVRPHKEVGRKLDGDGRASILAAAEQTPELFFPFGALTALARPKADGTILFEIFPASFPRRWFPLAIVEDAPPIDPPTFGRLGRVWFGGSTGLKSYLPTELENEVQAQLDRALDTLRRGAITAASLTETIHESERSAAGSRDLARLEAQITRAAAAEREAAASFAELAQRLGPGAGDAAVTVARVVTEPAAGESPAPAAAADNRPAAPPERPRPDQVAADERRAATK
jgi:serine protease Do